LRLDAFVVVQVFSRNSYAEDTATREKRKAFVVFRGDRWGVSGHCRRELPYIQRHQSGSAIASFLSEWISIDEVLASWMEVLPSSLPFLRLNGLQASSDFAPGFLFTA